MSRHPTLSPIEHRPQPFCSHFEVESLSASVMSSSSHAVQCEYDPPSRKPADQGSAYPSTTMPTPYPQLILFGDSITEFSTLTLQAYLQTQYVRRADVLNRGFSGFTTPMALQVLPKVLPQRRAEPDSLTPPVKIMTIFFGANDAVMPPAPQHVPLPIYMQSLAKMIRYIHTNRADDNTKVIIITPPPVDEHQFNPDNTRRACSTGQYAEAAQQIASKSNLPCLDLWSIIMKKAGWNESMGRDCCRYDEGLNNIPQGSKRPAINTSSIAVFGHCSPDNNHQRFPSLQSYTPSPTLTSTSIHDTAAVHIPGCIHAPPNEILASLLTDGLHLTTAGYKILFWSLLSLIKNEIPDCAPENCPYIISEWRKALGIEC